MSESVYKVTKCHAEYDRLPCPLYAPHLTTKSAHTINKLKDVKLKSSSRNRKLKAILKSEIVGNKCVEDVALCIDFENKYIEGNCATLIRKCFPNWEMSKPVRSGKKESSVELQHRFESQSIQDYFWEYPLSKDAVTRYAQLKRIFVARFLEVEVHNYFENTKIKSK